MSDYSTVVLFADLTGSVALYESLGDAQAKALVVELQNRLGNLVVECSGVVQEIIGDEIMCCFDEAEHAVACAAKIHQSASDYLPTQNQHLASSMPERVQMRIGIHCGPAILDQGRLFGDTVNTAARIMSVAQAGQTITTLAVLQKLPTEMQRFARRFDEITLKGKSEPTVVYDYPWQAQDLTQIQQVVAANTPRALQLAYGGNTFLVSMENCPAYLGRAINNQVVVDSEPVSRRHVSIEFQRGRFVLSDKSTNGTHVYPDNSEAIYLRREQMPLWGKGRFCLGAPVDDAHDNMVEYSCEFVREPARACK